LVELVAELLPDEDELVAAPEEPEDCDDAGEDELDELDEFEPQAATARATRTSARGASRRIDLGVTDFMNCSFAWESSRSPW